MGPTKPCCNQVGVPLDQHQYHPTDGLAAPQPGHQSPWGSGSPRFTAQRGPPTRAQVPLTSRALTYPHWFFCSKMQTRQGPTITSLHQTVNSKLLMPLSRPGAGSRSGPAVCPQAGGISSAPPPRRGLGFPLPVLLEPRNEGRTGSPLSHQHVDLGGHFLGLGVCLWSGRAVGRLLGPLPSSPL